MKKIKYYFEKYKIFIVLTLIVLFLMLTLIFNIISKPKSIDKPDIENIETENIVQEEKEDIEILKVDIKGYVENPGVYELNENSRVIDAINIAGGLKETANTDYINLSKKLVDEMVIIIYSEDETEKFKQTDKEIIYIEYECDCLDNINDACITEKDIVNTNGSTSSNESNSTYEKISINTATIEELMTLDGIGESKAKAIIEYREKNGEFKQLEEIMNVSGIGEAAYSKIKDNIKL